VSLVRVDRLYRGKPTHFYELDGKRVDGVTTVLNQGIPKPALTGWAAREVATYAAGNLDQIRDMLDSGGEGPTVAFLKGIPWQKRDEAAVRGTDVHALAEQLVNGVEVEVPEHLYGHVDGYARWLDEADITPLLTEFVVGSRTHGYAGTADLLIVDKHGVKRIADIKTSKGVYGETALQLAAYRFADFYLRKDEWQVTTARSTYKVEFDAELGAEMPLPQVDDTGWVIHVTAEGTQAVPVPVDETQFAAFLAAQQVARWAKGSRDLVGQPIRFDSEAVA
jgi:hypothetical protein